VGWIGTGAAGWPRGSGARGNGSVRQLRRRRGGDRRRHADAGVSEADHDRAHDAPRLGRSGGSVGLWLAGLASRAWPRRLGSARLARGKPAAALLDPLGLAAVELVGDIVVGVTLGTCFLADGLCAGLGLACTGRRVRC
jgi:hypothetical protein